MGALLPTLSAVPDPQVVYGSSAGLAQSDILRAIRDRGRPGGDPSLAYLEWCDDLPGSCLSPACSHELSADGCALDDRDRWVRSNPALGRRITFDYVAAERRALPPGEFARERLGWWDDPQLAGVVISESLWNGLVDPGSKLVGEVVFAFDVTPSRDYGAVAVAGRRADGLLHVEVVDVRAGTAWLGSRLDQLVTDHEAERVIVDASGPAGSLLEELEQAGVPVESMSGREYGQACAEFYDRAVDSRTLRHLGQPELSVALQGAAKRDIGDGGWGWGRRVSSANIAPLVAATLAVRGFLVYGEGLGPDDVTVR